MRGFLFVLHSLISMGYKGDSFMDSGYFYAPVPLAQYPVVMGSEDTDRRLKAVWTRESQEDLLAIRNLDAEEDLAAILAREIRAEIDAEIDAELGLIGTTLNANKFCRRETTKVEWTKEGF